VKSPLREMALALDDAALESLASKGLVRRASADVAAGRASLETEESGAAEVRVDGETAQVLADGPSVGRCSCPAPGVCRHRLAALILLRESATRGASGDVDTVAGLGVAPEPPPLPPVDWTGVMATITPDLMAQFAGRAGWREALGELERAQAAEVTPLAATLRVRLAPQAEPVVFLATGGLDSAFTKTAGRRRKVLVVAAALAARRAFGLAVGAALPADSTIVKAETVADAQTLETVREALCRAYGAALAFAPAALEAEIRRLALAGRVEAMPRLAASLRRLAAGFDPLRRRGSDADPDAMLELMAETYALTIALEAPIEASERAALIGQVREDYGPIGDLELFGLGAKLWETASGARGVTAYFYEPRLGEAFTLTQARADRSDIGFDPTTAFHHAPVWGWPMARLCAGDVRLSGASASASRRLSTSQNISADLHSWTPSVGSVRRWDCAASDWLALERRLQTILAGRLTAPAPAETPVILIITHYAPVRFDDLAQTLIWPLADRAGRWIGLTLPFEGVERDRIAVLERLTARERCWAVLATAAVSQGGIDLRPYALWGQSLHLLDFQPALDLYAKPASDLTKTLQRLKAGVGLATSGPQQRAGRRAYSDRLIDGGWDLLLRRAESGRSLPPIAFASDCRQMANAFARAGLLSLAKSFSAVAEPTAAVDAVLRAAWTIASARRRRARLPWMT
jgi:hypothetical protein